MKKSTVIIYVFVAAAVVAVLFWQSGTKTGQQVSNLNIPDLNASQTQGQKLFDDNCASCHGKNTAGTGQGPTFIHKVYAPGHHGDGAFYLAAKNGARAHHWSFGNMPPIAGVQKQEVALIVEYVRALQRANGIN